MQLEDIARTVCEGEDTEIGVLCQKALASGITSVDIIQQGLTKGMLQAAELFDEGEYFLPEMLLSSMTLQKGLDELEKEIEQQSEFWKGKIVIGTVAGDTHDIGKNLVCAMLRAAGFQVYDLGIEVEEETFIKAIYTYQPDIVAMSALLSTTMMNMQSVIRKIVEEGLRNQVKIMIGGAVVNENFAQKIGADGYSANAIEAVQLAEYLMTESKERVS